MMMRPAPIRPSMRRAALAVLALCLASGHAIAQQPPGQPPQPQQGYPDQGANDRSAACIRLEGQLAQISRGGGARPNLDAQISKQRATVDSLSAQARQMGCDKRGFLIFQPQLPPQCEALNGQLTQARSALDRTMMQARGDQGSNDEQRRQLIYALAQNDCGPQYRAAVNAGQSASTDNRRPRNFFEQLFGVPRGSDEEAGPIDQAPLDIPQVSVSTYRTVCVRTCDGFFFPISFAATPARFPSDEQMCQRQCPGTEARLFAYRNPGGDIDQAVAINGQPYSSLPNALLFKKEFVPACSCRPAGMSWAQALAGAEGVADPTLRKGDIVVTEDKAREMAQPRPATPPPAAAAPRPAAPKPAAPRPAAPAPGFAPPGTVQ
jgi:hypothetical protein